MTDAQRSSRTSTDLKNEDSYEISIPFEDNNTDESGFCTQTDHIFDAESALKQTSSCNPYLLIFNLRAQLQISLEKNSWLQKRIEDLEEERDFLRCQLDRVIFSTKCQERTELQPEVAQQPIPQKTVPRSAPAQSPKPMMTRSGQIPTRSQKVKQKRLKSSSAQDEKNKEVIEEEEYLEEDGYLEEAAMLSDDDDSDSKSCKSSKSAGGHMRVKRTRVFRIARGMERQRVKDPSGVLLRYNKILGTYQKLKSMSRAFQVHGVDRNTVASTTPIAELLLVAPEKVTEVGEFDSSKEKLLDYARRCYKALDEAAQAKVQALKKNNLLLPISYRFRN